MLGIKGFQPGHKHTSETKIKIGNANRNQIYFNCDYCGRIASDKPSHYARKRKHFCNRNCYAEYVKLLPSEKQNAYRDGGLPLAEKKRRIKARSDLNHAIRDGRLVRLSCEKCEAKNTHAHHDNYDKPLDVRWLCQKCHWQEHSNENPELLEEK